MKRTELLVVANTPSDNTQVLADAVWRGAAECADAEGVHVRRLQPPQATAEDVLRADAVILGTTENFGYMSGQLKDFLERIYYPCLGKNEALPWALYIRAGKDGTGTNRAVHSIIGGLSWREVQPPLLLVGAYQTSFVAACEELGATMAVGLSVGLF